MGEELEILTHTITARFESASLEESLSHLTPAELAAAKVRDRMASDPVDDAAQAMVKALRPILAAEALRWVAGQTDRWAGYCCHDHMARVVDNAAAEIEAGLDMASPAGRDGWWLRTVLGHDCPGEREAVVIVRSGSGRLDVMLADLHDRIATHDCESGNG